jgi:hypothetical protein
MFADPGVPTLLQHAGKVVEASKFCEKVVTSVQFVKKVKVLDQGLLSLAEHLLLTQK